MKITDLMAMNTKSITWLAWSVAKGGITLYRHEITAIVLATCVSVPQKASYDENNAGRINWNNRKIATTSCTILNLEAPTLNWKLNFWVFNE